MVFEENMPLLIASLAFVVVCLLFMGIIIFVRGARYRRRMLNKIRADEVEWSGMQQGASLIEGSGGSTGVMGGFLSALGMKANPGRAEDQDIKLMFLKAGLRGRNVPAMFWGTKFLLAVVMFMVVYTLGTVIYRDFVHLHVLLASIYFSLVGLFLPNFWLHFKTSRRKERISRGFPDALDLMVVCVEAGMGLDAAINRVGEELELSHPDLSQEFKLLNLELRAGKPRNRALKNLGERTDIDEVNSLVTLLTQTDRFGTSVAQALRVFSDSFRTARYQKAEEVAAKMATKLIFPLVLCIFPALFVVVLGPVMIQIYRVLLAD